MNNFKFLTDEPLFKSFAPAVMEAEKSLKVSPASVAIHARHGLELAVKWLYQHDADLQMPYKDNISSLIHEQTFKDIIDMSLFPMIKNIISMGNSAVHSNKHISRDQAILSLKNLFEMTSWIAYCYSDRYESAIFDESLLYCGKESGATTAELEKLSQKLTERDARVLAMEKENAKLKVMLTEKRHDHGKVNKFKVDKLTEAQTRVQYIDTELRSLGWIMDKDVLVEYPVIGMPSSSGRGSVDYVLFGDNGKPLAIVEAKRSTKNLHQGREQARLYVDCLEAMTGQRPIMFLSNGFDMEIWDDMSSSGPREVSGLFTKDELQIRINRRTTAVLTANIVIQDSITNRVYQKEAIRRVCEAFERNARKTLLVMATGSGKTRTAISLVDVLTRAHQVKNVLFLADRKVLVSQAKRNFKDLLPNLSLCNLLDSKDNPEESRMIFSTYPTMLNAIDETRTKAGTRLFTPGHFDLIIIDEAHRSVYKKYKDILTYFDASIVGLTATPKDEIDKNTYGVFQLENGVPTFAYELSQAVSEKHLLDYGIRRVESGFISDGIKYDDLSEEDKVQFEETFAEDENIDDYVESERINKTLFNHDTIDRILQELMLNGIKVESGDKLGKTIIFANNKDHARVIEERFNHLYPYHNGKFARVIVNDVNYVESLIGDFSTADKLPQIAISVDMLDTGVDIPEIVNLVFFKRVRSKSKFHQMIGRGTRLCPNLFGFEDDKKEFLIFDLYGNFEYFNLNPRGFEARAEITLTERLFGLRVFIVRALQHLNYQEETYIDYRNQLVDGLLFEVKGLNEELFQVKQRLRAVHQFKETSAWESLDVSKVNTLKRDIAPLIVSSDENELAKKFDVPMYRIMLSKLEQEIDARAISQVIETVRHLEKVGNIPQVSKQKEIIKQVQDKEFWNDASVLELDGIREALRELMQFNEKKYQVRYDTNFSDTVSFVKESSGLEYRVDDELQDYHAKVRHYLNQNKDNENLAVYKLRRNLPLTATDYENLEQVLWNELGSKEDYEAHYEDLPLGIMVRKIVGLDEVAVGEAFSEFLTNEQLNANQIHFVRLIIEHIEKNGLMSDRNILQQEPFKSFGNIINLFSGDANVIRKMMNVVDTFEANAKNVLEG